MADTTKRSDDFDVVRRGYDRAQVDTRMAELEAELERLRDDLVRATASGLAIGIDEQEALAAELHTIGGEVADILEAARAAAEGMRSRASSDVAEWREEAKSESEALVSDATEQSQSMRASAWNEGSSLLGSAAAEAQAIIDQANEDALFVRAEAEREAIRLTGDAKRDREELLRAARSESDQMIERARIESDGVLAAAAQQADLAQERARALEDRRSELLSELEATRASIGELESEIESRRQELEAPPEPDIEEPEDEGRSHHAGDGGSVRIVAPTRAVELKPVDADELMAEVQALRDGDAEAEAVEAPIEETPDVVVIAQPDVAGGSEPSAAPVVSAGAMAAPEQVPEDAVDAAVTAELPSIEAAEAPSNAPEPPEPTESEASPVDAAETEDAPQAEPLASAADGAADSPQAEPEQEPEQPDDEPEQPDDEPEQPGGGSNDVLGSLFAQLRTETTDESSKPDPVATDSQPETVPADEPAADASAVPDAAPSPREPSAESSTSEAPPAPMPVEDADSEPSTIPAQNVALRSIKRTLVDLQNETLDHLRTDASWDPAEEYTDRFGPAFSTLTIEIWGVDDPAVADAFAADLYDALQSALERSRSSGGGERAVASAASKVFRMWRSDEAEQRVVQAARTQPVSA